MLYMDSETHKTIARNLHSLMRHHGWNQMELARRAAVSQRTVSNLLNPGSIDSATISSVEKVALAFKIGVHILLTPNLPPELLESKTVDRLIDCYANSTQQGRDNTLRIAEAEMRYSTLNKAENGT